MDILSPEHEAFIDSMRDLKDLVEEGKAVLGQGAGLFGLYMLAARDLGAGVALEDAIQPIRDFMKPAPARGAHLTLVVDNA